MAIAVMGLASVAKPDTTKGQLTMQFVRYRNFRIKRLDDVK